MKTKSIQTTMVRALALGATAAFPSSWRRGLLTALLTVLGLTAGNAASLLSDNFTGVTTETLNANGWYFYNDNAAGTAWVIGNATHSPQSGSLLQNQGGTAGNSHALKQFTSQTLSVGQSLKLELDFSLGFTGPTMQYALWLGNSPTTITSNQFGGFPGWALPSGFTGYNVWGENNGAPGTNKYYNNAQIWGAGPAMGAATIMSTTPSTLALTVTRVAAGTEVGWSVNGTQTGSSWIDTSNPLDTFNTVVLFGNAAQPKFDNISVSVIPEPSTFAMLLFGGALAVWRKRVVRRRSSV